MLSLTSLGGAGTVTGSKHLLQSQGRSLLVDCGLFQGQKALREQNWAPFPVDAAKLGGVVLTHAHLDHSGYIPKLVKEGFRERIVSTHATMELCDILLRDSGHIQESDADRANRYGYSKHKPALPLYGVRDAERALEFFSPAEVHKPLQLPGGARLVLRRAGHILGAATAELEWAGRKVVFSGDLGRYDDEMMRDPEPVPEADYLLVESTYGNRRHEQTDSTEALGKAIERTIQRGGTVVIPAFAVGRAQALLYHIWKLKQAGRIGLVPVYLDSPMAIDASEMLCSHLDDHRLTPEVCRAACAVATYTRDVEASKEITRNTMPKVIIAASGMATGGRVLHHLKAYGPDRRNLILFSGFQAAGTRGSALLGGAKEVKIHGQWIPIHAEVRNLPMLSAHADAEEILRWLGGFKRPPKRTFIVHGEPDASETLRTRIEGELGWPCTVSAPMQRYEL
ncbi:MULTISPECIES: MBL fold metallo-hydrolase RNA specificity domain-containing protein [unclassified Phenylobacterium]|jgi:metallo-beta-lactamase family protein|uniref:MBL fold metallo-hydrolase RNA specificity domain-containing protein n=1 Tax=unclassified Phenylobacterium TaxID=2640670 RepID=UPI00083A4FB9|nr:MULTISPECIES: MBL fold metallo-hydrolase [unclassified Phenylobacterium]